MKPRIRTIKPEFFQHERLYDAEVESGLPLRLAFIGLWSICDREGRFEWRPRAIKANVMPYDEIDFSRVLHALATRGFVVFYTSGTRDFGFIPGFLRHQVVNNREGASELPEPPQDADIAQDLTRAPRVPDACPTRHDLALAEGKGREGKGKEEDGGGGSACAGAENPVQEAGGNPPEPVSQDLLEQVIDAAGIDLDRDRRPARWFGSEPRIAIGRWQALGLTDAEILTEVAAVTAGKRDGPPASLAYFDGAMQRLAGAKAAPPLDPTAPPPGRPQQPENRVIDVRAVLAQMHRERAAAGKENP